MDIIQSCNEKNAVKVIAFAFTFAKVLTLEEIETIIGNLQNDTLIQRSFNKLDRQQEFSMTIGPEGTSKSNQTMGGLVCSSLDEETKKVKWTLEVNKNSILITCRDYSRWDNVSPIAFELIAAIFKYIPESENRIGNLTLEYSDEFLIVKPHENWKKVLFKPSKFLLPNVFEINEFWHVNHGYFYPVSTKNENVLHTVAIQYYADEMDSLNEKVNIRMQHKVIYLDGITYDNKFINESFNELHIYSKANVFEEIISEEILEKFDRGVQKC